MICFISPFGYYFKVFLYGDEGCKSALEVTVLEPIQSISVIEHFPRLIFLLRVH